jgi:hypothetical protein
VNLRPTDLAVLAAVVRGEVRGEASAWWYVGGPDPALSAAGIEPQTRITGRVRRLQRADAVVLANPPAAMRTVAEPTDRGRQLLIAPLPPGLIAAQALRAYADRWHGTTEGIRQPVDYGTGVEYDEVCACGASIGEDQACAERQQLLADADALEAGREPTPVGDLPAAEAMPA